MAIDMTITGVTELQRTLDDLGKLPQRCVTKAANKGARELLRAIKAAAPVETGDLRRGIVVKPEKSKRRGKKFYQVVFDYKMNDVFVKYSKDGKRYYYPSSMEYGFKTRDGGWTPGYRFMKKTADAQDTNVKTTMVRVLNEELDKLK